MRVYKFGCKPPIEHIDLVRLEIRGGHNYANDLTAIERGRRHAVRALLDVPAVHAAEDALRAAPRAARKEALSALSAARREALDFASRCEQLTEVFEAEAKLQAAIENKARDRDVSILKHALKVARAEAGDRCARIALLDESIRKDAYALARCAWGTRLTIAASADQSRKAPLFEDDALTPADPRFERWSGFRAYHETGHGQITVQLQGGLSTPDVYACTDTRVRLAPDRFSDRKPTGHPWRVLWLRVGSDGREPVWTKVPVRIHRAIPDDAVWKWVRLSCRHEGRREYWSVEITLSHSQEDVRALDVALDGAIAVEATWDSVGDQVRAAVWRDSRGQSGELMLSKYDVEALGKDDGIRSVRDKLLNELRPALSIAPAPGAIDPAAWLVKEFSTIELWRSPQRFHSLEIRWRQEAPETAPEVLALLSGWAKRDLHLWDYESGVRGQTLRRRRELYRVTAARWSREYRTLLVDDRDLSREARWGKASDVRFMAAPSELRSCLRAAFGEDVVERPYREEVVEGDDRDWCERAIHAWIAGDARVAEKEEKLQGGAWSRRKAKGRER